MAKVMIVEDEINIAKGLDNIIKSINSELETTVTGYAKEALDAAITQTYDMFLLDIQLKDYSGFELAKQLRNIDKYKLTPIVFITAIPTKELLAFKEIHCYDYIIKPFREYEVIKVVDTLINYGIKKSTRKEYISFNLKDFTYRIKLEDVIYFEVIQRKIKVVTDKEELEVSHYTLYSLMEELNDDFIQCHRGYIVNTNYISKIDKINNYIYLEFKDIKIPIGRKFKDCLRGVFNESS